MKNWTSEELSFSIYLRINKKLFENTQHLNVSTVWSSEHSTSCVEQEMGPKWAPFSSSLFWTIFREELANTNHEIEVKAVKLTNTSAQSLN